MTQDNEEQSGEKKRKVAKTMLFRKPAKPQGVPPVAPFQEGRASSQPQPQPQPEAQPQQQPPQQPPQQMPVPVPEPLPAIPKTKVAKTKLDHKLIANLRASFEERENERLQEEVSKRQAEPVKEIEPIEADRTVSSCPFSWTEESPKERFKHCANCQRTIYNFDGIEFDQAEALILKRENREKFVLYQRPDGKFMTSDCPVAQRRRLQIAGLIGGVIVCIAVAVAGFVMMPPAPPPTPAITNENPAPVAVPSEPDSSSTRSNSSSSTSTGTTHHYVAGDPMPVVPPASSPAQSKPPEKTFSESEQKGDFWEFPNGQRAD